MMEATDNFSDNYGIEGETTDAGIEALRKRQIKNFLLTLLVSRGVPMLLGGDEFRRTQSGNNNAWCQDNDTSWFDWTWLERHRETHQFIRGMIAFRRAHPALSKESFYTDSEIQWLSPTGGQSNWSRPERKNIRLRYSGEQWQQASDDVQCRCQRNRFCPAATAAGILLASGGRYVRFRAAGLVHRWRGTGCGSFKILAPKPPRQRDIRDTKGRA